MRIFNKLVTLLVLLALIVLTPAVLFVPGTIAEAVIEGVGMMQGLLDEALAAQPVLYYAVGAIVELVLIALLLLELRSRPQKEQGRVKLVDGGTVEVAYRPIATRLEKVTSEISGIKNVIVEVSTARRRLKVGYDITLRPGTTARTVTAEVERATRETVEHKLGIKMAGKPNVNYQLKQATRDPAEPPEPRRPAVQTEPEPEKKSGGLFGFGKKGKTEDTPPEEEPADIGRVTPPPPVRPPGGFFPPSAGSDDE